MTHQDVVSRARSAVNQGTIYKLGAGDYVSDLEWRTGLIQPETAVAGPGEIVASAMSSPASGYCDCSGFAAWALKRKRHVTDNPWYTEHNGEWMNTDAIVRDALSPFGFFDEIGTPEPGCLIVFPRLPGQVAGHVGIVTEVPREWVRLNDPSSVQALRVVHCSAGNYAKKSEAILETDAAVFQNRPGLLFAWFAGVETVT